MEVIHMIFDRNANKPVIALLGAGSMGTAKLQRSFQPRAQDRRREEDPAG